MVGLRINGTEQGWFFFFPAKRTQEYVLQTYNLGDFENKDR